MAVVFGSPASEQSTHHAADQATWTATAPVMARTSSAARMARMAVTGIVTAAGVGVRRRDRIGQQRLMLLRVEEAGPGITACLLPARDGGAGRLVKLSADLGAEAETGQRALHVAARPLVEADLVFGLLSRFVGKGHLIDCYRQVAVGRARAGFGGIRTDENAQHRKCENQDTHGIFPDLEFSQ